MQNKSVVVFAPHPDDETLGCGGTIAKEVRKGSDIYIVFITNGENSHRNVLNIYRNPSPDELGVIRKSEAIHAARILGVNKDKLIFLDFEDCHLEYNISEAKRQIRQILNRIKPNEVFIPCEVDTHRDHLITNLLVSLCIKEIGADAKIYEYGIWLSNIRIENLVPVNISDTFKIKEKAINAYESQIKILFPSQKMSVLSSEFVERFKRPEELFIKKQHISFFKIYIKLLSIRVRVFLKKYLGMMNVRMSLTDERRKDEK